MSRVEEAPTAIEPGTWQRYETATLPAGLAREQRAQLGEGAPGPAAEDEAPGGDLDFDEFLVLSSSSDEEMPPDNEMPEAKQAANEGDLDDQEPVPALDLDEEDELAGGGGSETLGGVIGTLLLTLNAQFHLPHLGVRAALRCLNQAEDPDARPGAPDLPALQKHHLVIPRTKHWAVCPECMALHDVPAVSREQVVCAACGTNVLEPQEERGARRGREGRGWRAKIVYPVASIADQISAVYKRLCASGAIDAHRRLRVEAMLRGSDVFGDILDGAAAQSIADADGSRFFHPGKTHVGLIVYSDSYQAGGSVASKMYSTALTVAAIANLPMKLRTRAENMIWISQAPGPKDPNPNQMQALMEPWVSELQTLWDIGLSLPITATRNERCRVAVVCVSCDLPAASKISGIPKHSSRYFCHKCTVRNTNRHLRGAVIFRPRTHESLVRAGQAYLGTADWSALARLQWVSSHLPLDLEYPCVPGERKRPNPLPARIANHPWGGARFTVLANLPYFDIPAMVIKDPAHCVLQGLVRQFLIDCVQGSEDDAPDTRDEPDRHCRLWPRHIAELERAQRCVNPSAMGTVPSNINAAHWTTDELRAYVEGPGWVIFPYEYQRLMRLQNQSQLRCDCVLRKWLLLCEIIILLMARQPLRSTLPRLNNLVAKFQERVTQNWGPSAWTANLHYLTHLPDQLRLNGPAYQHLTFPGERACRLAKAQKTNHRSAREVTTLTGVLRSHALKHQLAEAAQADPDGRTPLGALAQCLKEKEASRRGTLASQRYADEADLNNPAHSCEYSLQAAQQPLGSLPLSRTCVAAVLRELAALAGDSGDSFVGPTHLPAHARKWQVPSHASFYGATRFSLSRRLLAHPDPLRTPGDGRVLVHLASTGQSHIGHVREIFVVQLHNSEAGASCPKMFVAIDPLLPVPAPPYAELPVRWSRAMQPHFFAVDPTPRPAKVIVHISGVSLHVFETELTLPSRKLRAVVFYVRNIVNWA